MDITVYHNPKCGTSRGVLQLLADKGHSPVVIEYLKTPPGRDRLEWMIARMGVPVREMMRQKGSPYFELGLDDPKVSDAELVTHMLAEPILINRPIVVVGDQVRLCRPSESVLELIAD